jgi:hypothetical protein
MNWARAVEHLNRAVVRSLGEDLLLEQHGESARVRGVLTDPEHTGTVAGADFVMAEAMLVIRTADGPAWLARGTTVTRANTKAYGVIRVVDNGEGLLEVTLCPSS